MPTLDAPWLGPRPAGYLKPEQPRCVNGHLCALCLQLLMPTERKGDSTQPRPDGQQALSPAEQHQHTPEGS